MYRTFGTIGAPAPFQKGDCILSRINVPTSIDTAPEAARPLLEAIKAKLGSVPNVFRLISNSPAALGGLRSLQGALDGGALDPHTRERIALAIANVNGGDYCNAAHTAIAKSLELDEREIEAARGGGSDNAKADAAVSFARKVAVQRGDVTDADLQRVRDAGYSDAELVEIVARVALSTFTNYVNEVFKTPIDFPVAALASRAV
jgi:uncharacterized peroxidase-related enzyme